MRPKQNPAVAGFTLNPLYPATEELWGVLLSVSCPSSLSGFRQRTICSDRYRSSGVSVLTDKRQEILWKMSQFSWKVHYRSLHQEYNINLNRIVKTSTNICGCTHVCSSLWDSSPNPWVRKGKFLSVCQEKKKNLFTLLSPLEGWPGAPSQYYPNFPSPSPQTHSFFFTP